MSRTSTKATKTMSINILFLMIIIIINISLDHALLIEKMTINAKRNAQNFIIISEKNKRKFLKHFKQSSPNKDW